MRLISFALTTDQVRAQTKTQTRRLGWEHAKVGDRLRGVRKVQGRRKDEPLVDLAIVEITAVRTERLCDISADDLAREGFPGMSAQDFALKFPCEPTAEVTVIDFKYLDDEVVLDVANGWAPEYVAALLDNVKAGKHKPGTVDAVNAAVKRARAATNDRKGADPSEWPKDLRVQEMPK